MINFNPSFPYNNQYPMPLAQANNQNVPLYNSLPLYPTPIYTALPYGINQTNYVKTGVQMTPSGNEIHFYKLTNGQNIALIKGDGCPVVQTTIKAGAFDESDDKRGISHLIEHSIYHESEKYKDIEDEIKTLGGYSNASTGFNATEYHIILDNKNRENLDKAIDIEADMIFNPKFSKLDKEKAIVIQEAKKYEADETNNLSNALKKNLFNLNHISAKDIMSGDSSKLGSITKEDMLAYHNMFYTPSNMTTVIISGENPDELIKTVADKFQTAAKGKSFISQPVRPNITPVNTFTRYDEISKDDPIGLVKVGFALPDSNNIAESVKTQALMQLIYNRSDFEISKSDGHNGIATGTFTIPMENSNEYELFQNLKEKFIGVMTNPPDDCEMSNIKNLMLDRFDRNFISNEDVSNYIGAYILGGGNNTVSYEKDVIKNLTKEDIVDALKYFDTTKCSLAVLHPMGTTQEQIQSDWEKSKTYAPSVIIPKYTQKTEIANSLNVLNIEPYSSKPVYTGVLPNNSIFNAVNSKTDNCFVFWSLYAPDNNAENVAAKYLLTEMITPPSVKFQYDKFKNNNKLSAILDIPNQFIFSAGAPSDNIVDAISGLKYVTDIDFTENTFDDAKKKALLTIDSNKEKAFDMYKKHRYGANNEMNPDEIKRQLEKLSLDDVRKYYNDIILNAYSTISVSAPFDKKPELLNEIANALNTPSFSFKPKDSKMFRSAYIEKPQNTCFIKEQKTEQPRFQSIYNFKISGNPADEIKFEILANILSKRLFDDLRESKGLAYDVSSYYENTGNDGKMILDLSSSSDDKDIPQIFEGFKQNVQQILNGEITQKELDAAKSSYKRSGYTLFDSQFSTLVKLDCLSCMPSGISSMQEDFKILDGITVDDIKQAARYVFKEKPDYLADCTLCAINQNGEYFKNLSDYQIKA